VTTSKRFYSSLAEQLTRRATRAVLGLTGFRNDALREHLRERFGQDPGISGSFLADPVFEATFGWQQANVTMEALDGKLLNTKLLLALDKPQKKDLIEDYTFPLDRHPYQHQLEAWQNLIQGSPPRSVLVSSGTGSGKTECFLVPILNDLANELEERQDASLTGVQALFLYPLNALIKSQKDRLVAWSEPFDGKLRFCLYNGDTPDLPPKNHWQCEVPDRRTLRNNPPPILVTNTTMLEYMLVRNQDKPIIEQSKGKLRWIVIDEAHTYLGSQAAELTLLLRRVLHAFECKSEDVHFVATSATLGDASEESKQQLAAFLADIAGVPIEQVTVVTGERHVPALPSELVCQHEQRPPLTKLWDMTSEERFDVLAKDPVTRKLREQLTQKARHLTGLVELLYGDEALEKDRHTTLELLDLCTQANKKLNKRKEETPFLPLRGHFFQRTLNGLWACSNSKCSGRHNTYLASPEWSFGTVFLERRESCSHCKSPVFELVQCSECRSEYLSAAEEYKDAKEWLRPRKNDLGEDEFQQELEPLDDDETEETEIEVQSDETKQLPRLVTSYKLATQKNWGLSQDGQLDVSGKMGNQIHLFDAINECPACSAKEKPKKPNSLFHPIRVGAPFLLSTAIPTLLEPLAPMKGNDPRPFEGRRLITFTDSRQGTARFAAKLQQDSERNYIRSLIYHHLAKNGNQQQVDLREIDKVRQEINELKPLSESSSIIKNMLNDKLLELKKLETPQMGHLTWKKMEEKLLLSVDISNWVLNDLKALTFEAFQRERDYVKLCLLREFFVRPKRQTSLETLGLVQLKYPNLWKVEPTALFKQRKVSKEEWQALLQIAIDYILRTGGSATNVTREFSRWLGFPARAMFILGSNNQRKSAKSQRYWPSVKHSSFHKNRLVRLLSYAFNLDLDKKDHINQLNEMLSDIWNGIRPILTEFEGNSYNIDLEEQVELFQVRDAWLCPVTRRLLPVTFRNITPYLPLSPKNSELVICKKIKMPDMPYYFGSSKEKNDIQEWLEKDDRVVELREFGAWPDISDRIISFSNYWRAAEHSAQISGHDLTKREAKFKEGEINLLSCSTTMEMGVDIGGLSAIAMNNVPPHPANFLQRAGRAGRRGETAAVSFTLCKATPHGEAVFKNPLWPFETRLSIPKVALESAPIVQRHINSLVLSVFLSERTNDGLNKLTTGWFFESEIEDVSPAYERFKDWCGRDAQQQDSLMQGVSDLIRRSVLDGRQLAYLLEKTSEAIQVVAQHWLADLTALISQREAVKTKEGDSKPEKSIDLQLKRLRGEYLLGILATLGFLPGYGFPTDVVSLITTTAEELSRKSNAKFSEREDNRSKRAGYPSRNLAVAIRDYAPGTDTVLDGRVYRSQGLTLNWQVPAEAEAAPEIQSLKWVWRCLTCGNNGVRQVKPECCPHCVETDNQKLTTFQFVQPAGFAVNIRDEPHNDITKPQYIPVRDPLISLDGSDWMALPTPQFGRYRSSIQGHLFHYSDGLHGKGYSLCLVCGWADSMTAQDMESTEHAASFKNHKRLRGGKNDDREMACPGNDNDWAIKDNLRLGISTQTEIFELQLNDVQGRGIDGKVAHTLAIALRQALCLELGIEDAEVGAFASPSRNIEGQSTYSIYLYDTATGGAGYSSQAVSILNTLFSKVRNNVLVCPSDCDAACQACLLTYDTQHHLDHLNRHKAIEFLDGDLLSSLILPENLKAFSEDTHFELEPLALALNREWQKHSINEIRFYLGGDAETWEPLAWRLRHDLARLVDMGAIVRFISPSHSLVALADSQKDELNALVVSIGAEFYEGTAILSSSTPLIMEMGGEKESVRWAASNTNALAPNPEWGVAGDSNIQFVRMLANEPLPPLLKSWKWIELKELRQSVPSANELIITNQFDGAFMSFGEQAWNFICKNVPVLAKRLDTSPTLIEVRYSDRYLRSPLTLLLLHSFLKGLENYVGGVTGATKIDVCTSELGGYGKSYLRQFNHDWLDEEDRRQVAEHWFKSSFPKSKWLLHKNKELPHARELELIWADSKWVIRLDQGVGYWVIQRHIRSDFPFDRHIDQQVESLKKANLKIEQGDKNNPTYWYCREV
jgi:ATP-dependent helicase YprA (DUF1998 family)